MILSQGVGQVNEQVEQVSRVYVSTAQVCHHPADRSELHSSCWGGSGYKMRRITWERHSSADSAHPLWSSGSRQFNSEATFVKCLGPLDPSVDLVVMDSDVQVGSDIQIVEFGLFMFLFVIIRIRAETWWSVLLNLKCVCSVLDVVCVIVFKKLHDYIILHVTTC